MTIYTAPKARPVLGVPLLDLNQITPDPTLLAQMPPSLAVFYEALPVAREDDQVTVVMSHPDNTTAIATLSRVLQATIVPVRSAAAPLRAAIRSVYPSQLTNDHNILAWLTTSDDPAQPAWGRAWLDALARCLAAQVIEVDAGAVDLATLHDAVRSGGYVLTACEWQAPAGRELPLAALLRDLATPLLLLTHVTLPRPETRRVLVVLRGYASDEQAIGWLSRLTPLVDTVVLLPLVGEAPWGGLAFLDEADPTHPHVQRCVAALEAAGLSPLVTLQPGAPVDQIHHALRQADYDLMIIAAEGQGLFVHQVLSHAPFGRDPQAVPAVLVLKPQPEVGGLWAR